ncbi:sensor histidine kinase [Lacrimispora sp.]|uniref:sensor histidine kinase n=1 Tax=Lacrimispora sp. TaxID=2719234 RepID=UPI002FD9548A
MLIILAVGLVIASMLILFLKKSKESMYLFGLCLSLMLEICGVMLFIAKKGGISPEIISLFYFSRRIKNEIQYFLITLNQMGYLIALGRTLFPYFLIKLAMNYSMIPVIRRKQWITRGVSVLPVITLILYYPGIYRFITSDSPTVQIILVNGTLFWMTSYLLIAAFLLLYEFKSITMKFCKKQFSQIMICLFALSGIYYLYYRQDPGQVYRFYWYTYSWSKGIGYMQVNPSLLSYLTLVIISVICCILGFYSLFRFTRRTYMDNKEDVVMERKFDSVKVGVSVFVHSMKNQLLSNKVVYKRIDQLYGQPEVDVQKLREYITTLEEVNNLMLGRMEELYRCAKSNAIYMVPVSVKEIMEYTLELFRKKYPDACVHIDAGAETVILADKVHLCEALYNLLINAQEAVLSSERKEEGEVALLCHNERLYTVIEIRDNGCGMDKSHTKKIFEPFYSSKNSNYNWGMGLYYVREIVKSHFGSLRVESRKGKGSSFYILLPKYQ